MTLEEFAQRHLPALRRDEVAFNVQIAVLQSAVATKPDGFEFWSLGGAGACAMKSPGRPLLLGTLDREACEQLADLTRDVAYPAVVGLAPAVHLFADTTAAHGVIFATIIPTRIFVLDRPPRFPGVEGVARGLTADDAPLLFDWLTAATGEMLPDQPMPSRDDAAKKAVSGRFVFWTVDGVPVSMAAVVRTLETTQAIGGVYTPRHLRGRGYAGSAVAAVCERIFAAGTRTACLYTDVRNPASNRCYAKIGFQPYLDAAHAVRAPA